MENKITFSSDTKEIEIIDMDEVGALGEEFFGTQTDPNQISITKENKEWIFNRIPNYINIIRNSNKIIGYTLTLPCTKNIMELFLTRKINEAQLFEKIKNLNLNEPPEALYLCAAIVRKEYQQKGLATKSFIKTINSIIDLNDKPVLFYWKFSEEGKRLAEKISQITNLKLKSLID